MTAANTFTRTYTPKTVAQPRTVKQLVAGIASKLGDR